MYTYQLIYIYTYVHVYIYIYLSIYLSISIYLYIHICISIHIYVCVYIYIKNIYLIYISGYGGFRVSDTKFQGSGLELPANETASDASVLRKSGSPDSARACLRVQM